MQHVLKASVPHGGVALFWKNTLDDVVSPLEEIDLDRIVAIRCHVNDVNLLFICVFAYLHRAMTLRSLRLQLHGAIYRPDSFVLMLRYCANSKAIRYESTTLNGIVADKSHRVIAA